ncbi:MAG: hypothetical protein K2X57_07690 [Xanthobacteraceae bacterium]|nr:hypothetical protein [Xanthobacteraceae bacterium]
MPLARYFTFTGSLLLALLFLADWYLPKLVAAPARAGVDKTIIRLHSAHKWPEATVFDTSLPTIVPPPSPSIVTQGPPPPLITQADAPTRAFAMAITEPPAAWAGRLKPARKQAGKRRPRIANARAPHVASYDFGFRSVVPAAW